MGKRWTAEDIPRDPESKRAGKPRSRRLDLNGVEIAIERRFPGKRGLTVKSFLKDIARIDGQTIAKVLDDPDHWTGAGIIAAILNALEANDARLILISCREPLAEADDFYLRKVVWNVLHDHRDEVYAQAGDDIEDSVNVFKLFYPKAPPRALQIARDHPYMLLQALRAWARDGELQEIDDSCFVPLYKTRDQLNRLAGCTVELFEKVILRHLSEAVEANDPPRPIASLLYNLNLHLNAAYKNREKGLDFRCCRRLFFEAFALDLAGSLGQTIGQLLDQLDVPFLRVRYLMKIKYDFVSAAYRADMEVINRPSLRLMREIVAAIDPETGYVDATLVNLFRELIGLVQDEMNRHTELTEELIGNGKLDEKGRVVLTDMGEGDAA